MNLSHKFLDAMLYYQQDDTMEPVPLKELERYSRAPGGIKRMYKIGSNDRIVWKRLLYELQDSDDLKINMPYGPGGSANIVLNGVHYEVQMFSLINSWLHKAGAITMVVPERVDV